MDVTDHENRRQSSKPGLRLPPRQPGGGDRASRQHGAYNPPAMEDANFLRLPRRPRAGSVLGRGDAGGRP